MANDCVGADVENIVNSLTPGDIVLLENLRFHHAEEHPDDDPSFARNLAKLADAYVNDAFGAAHRDHSSITTITKYFPNNSASGFLMTKEIQFLGNALMNPEKPFYAILGGAKTSTKTWSNSFSS